MLITVAGVLDPEALGEIRSTLQNLAWRDGGETAGASARLVKRNRQADLASREGAKLHVRLREALEAHPVIRAAGRPKRLSRLMISASGPGEGYGAHVDNALMARQGDVMRTDLAFTLFLSDPADYVGGELVVEHPGFEHVVKPDAGDVVLYPASSIHRVEPVRQGERMVCLGWMQSHVRDPAQREVLFDLETVRADVAASAAAGPRVLLTLDKTIANLLRHWADG